jgi:hypothetical protein
MPSQSELIRQAAKQILQSAEHPLSQREIKSKMDELGIVIKAKNPIELIRAALRRHPSEFGHIKTKGWVLATPVNA